MARLEISSVHEMHTMKLRFHEQTEIRYNHVLHVDRANSKPVQSLAMREDERVSFYKMQRDNQK